MICVGAQSNVLSENSGEVYDKERDMFYRIGRFLGKGGFARCYEVTAKSRGAKPIAAKVVSRESITKKSARIKVGLFWDNFKAFDLKMMV